MTILFTPSQLSYKQDISPINFRIAPLSLLWSDIQLVPSLIVTLFQIVLPFPTNNLRSELNPRSLGNVITIVLQIVLAVTTLMGFIGSVIVIFLPIPIIGFALYIAIATLLCLPGDFY